MVTIDSSITPVKGIAFDLEGTIIDIEALHHAAHLRAAAEVGVSLSWQEAIDELPHFIGGPDEKVAEEIASLAPNGASEQEVLSAKQTYFEELLEKHKAIVPREGFQEVLSWLKNMQIGIAIGTVSSRMLALKLLYRTELLPEFDEKVIVTREDVGLAKPSPDVYLETARRIGISPEKQLVFEDSVIGVNAACAARSYIAALPTIHEPNFIESLYRAGAKKVFKTWRDPDIRSFVRKLIGEKGQ